MTFDLWKNMMKIRKLIKIRCKDIDPINLIDTERAKQIYFQARKRHLAAFNNFQNALKDKYGKKQKPNQKQIDYTRVF